MARFPVTAPQQDWRPVPDPTQLTTDAVSAATGQWRRELMAVRELLEARLSAMDRATELLASGLNHVPSETDKAVMALRELLETRLAGMDVAISLTSDGLGRVLTETGNTAASQREVLSGEINAVRGQLHDLKEIFETRLAGMDEATKLLATNVDKVPYAILQEAGNLKAFIMSRIDEVQHVADQRFGAVDAQFASNALALTAALAAQKEAACMSADERILCADLTWRPAGDLLPGDELIAFDEDGPRCYRRAVVTANVLERDPLLRVNTPMGSVRCTYEHPWLVRRYRGHAWEWRRTDGLRPGDVVMKPLDVWDVDRSYEAGWLAGILDGEGCLGFKSRRNGGGKLSIGQVDGVVADLIDDALKKTGVTVARHTRVAQAYSRGSVTGHAQEQRRWEVNGRADIMRILGTVRPARFLAHADQVWEGFAIKSASRNVSRLTPVESVESAGTGLVARLSTSTRTYIGAGFAMHNSEQNKSNTLAIAKSEQATKETIAANAATTANSLTSISATIADLKDRLVRLEAGGVAVRGERSEQREVRGESRLNLGTFVSVGALVLALLTFVILYVVKK